MAETTIPKDTSELNRKTSRDVRCERCGQRRTIDGYDEPTVAACIADCSNFFVIPAYPFTNDEIEHVDGFEQAKSILDSI